METFPGFPLIRTKMMIPTMRTRMVHRSHLIKKIDDGINQGFILVSSPPGYGKTTLIADWAQRVLTPVAWLTLDKEDNYLPTLNRYLHSIVEKFFPAIKQQAADFPPEGNAEEYFHFLIVALINGCAQADIDFSLVLDDYQVVQNPWIHKGIEYLLEHFPNHLRLIIATRCDPPFPLSRLHAGNQILDITEADLTFSETEAKEFLNETAHLHLTQPEIDWFYQQTEGWITGLQLLALSHIFPEDTQANHHIISEDSNVIRDYMIEEVINRQLTEVQDFLLRTSILDNLTGPLCDYVLGKNDTLGESQKLLEELYHGNLFLIALDKEESIFRYHPLFTNALRHLLNEKHPGEVSNLYIRASEWFHRNGLAQEALSYAEASGDKRRMISLLETYALLEKNRGILDFSGWIKKIGEELVSTSPILCIIYSWTLMVSFELDSSEIWMERAKKLLGKRGNNPKNIPEEDSLWGLVYAAQSTLAVLRGNTNEAFELSKKALNLLAEENSLSQCFTLLDRAILLSFSGETKEAIEILTKIIRISQASGIWLVMMVARSLLGELYIDMGKLSQAMVLFQQSLSFMSSTPRKFTGLEGFLYKEIGEIYLLRRQLSEADRLLHKGSELSLGWLPALSELDSHLRLAHLAQCLGDFKGMKEEFSLARQIANISEGKLDDLIIDIFEAKLYLLKGQTSLANNWAIKYRLLEKDYQNYLNQFTFVIRVSAQTLLARLHIIEGRYSAKPEKFQLALEVLNDLVQPLLKSGLNLTLIEVYILIALVYFEVGRESEMIAYIEKALILAEPEEIRHPFIDEGIPMVRLLNRYLAHQKLSKSTEGIPSRNFVSDLLFRFSKPETAVEKTEKSLELDSVDNAMIIELLTTRETEVLNLVAQGRTNHEIAQTLFLSINTVKRHLNNIFLKLGVNTRTQAIAVARQHGFIR
ncbi:MAG: hypothetical protein GYA34_03080 [Chloroflexi bacterium]|nr:hypothetical protein [Chloroflexota bacterium]